jgi:hypothetical protein
MVVRGEAGMAMRAGVNDRCDAGAKPSMRSHLARHDDGDCPLPRAFDAAYARRKLRQGLNYTRGCCRDCHSRWSRAMAAISSSSRIPQAPAPMSLTASGGGGFWRAKRRGHVGIVQLLAKARARLQLDELGKSLGYPFTKKNSNTYCPSTSHASSLLSLSLFLPHTTPPLRKSPPFPLRTLHFPR